MSERIQFETSDRVTIVGSFLTSATSTRVALLLHMMPADRRSWQDFQQALLKQNISSLAIDLRGHGESLQQEGRTLHYQSFTDQEQQASLEDVRASLRWLTQKKFAQNQTALVGASIGANLALRIAVEMPDLRAIALLSPGENYHGLTTFDVISRLTSTQAVWAAASAGDDEASFQAAKKIVQQAASQHKIFKPYTQAGHGTDLFLHDPKLPDELVDWISQQLS